LEILNVVSVFTYFFLSSNIASHDIFIYSFVSQAINPNWFAKFHGPMEQIRNGWRRLHTILHMDCWQLGRRLDWDWLTFRHLHWFHSKNIFFDTSIIFVMIKIYAWSNSDLLSRESIPFWTSMASQSQDTAITSPTLEVSGYSWWILSTPTFFNFVFYSTSVFFKIISEN
jgi:hypothetical protein